MERSAAGLVWDQIGVVNCGILPVGPIEYEYYDDTPYAGLNHYRLVREDVEGELTLGNPMTVVHTGALGLSLLPNPVEVGGALNLMFQGEEHHEL